MLGLINFASKLVDDGCHPMCLAQQQINPFSFRLHCLTAADQAYFSELVTYLQHARQQMFADLAPTTLADDLQNFQQVYIDDDLGCFLLLKAQQKIVACIGFRAYDQRFSHFTLAGTRVVEVLRLYVEPDYRRRGLASYLLQQLKIQAQARAIDGLYLHTHPFLAGAVEFWQQQQFTLICQDHHDPIWQTMHMYAPC